MNLGGMRKPNNHHDNHIFELVLHGKRCPFYALIIHCGGSIDYQLRDPVGRKRGDHSEEHPRE